MKLRGDKVKRLGLFVFYDEDSIVDDYVLFLLADLQKSCQDIIVICNGKVNKEGLKRLKWYAKKIIERENKGLDAGALKEYFTTYKDYLKYDEVVILNDTFFGPFSSFTKVFKKMQSKDIDFWGLTLGHPQKDGYHLFKEGIPEHIQTFFLVLRKNVLESSPFKDYWQNYSIKEKDTFQKVVTGHEITFTSYLKEAGFKYDAYIKEDNVSPYYWQNYNNYAYNTVNQIIAKQALFIKRKTVVSKREEVLYLTDEPDLKTSLSYIALKTPYDMRLIFQNILRRYSLNDVMKSIGKFKIILPTPKIFSSYTFLLFINDVYVASKIEKNLENTLIYTTEKEVYDNLNKKSISVTLCANSLKETFLTSLKSLSTPYLGVVYLPKNNDITLLGEATFNNAFENLMGMGSSTYVQGILKLFMEDENLGMVYAPNNYHHDNFIKNLRWTEEEKAFFIKNYPSSKEDDIPFIKTTAWLIKKETLENMDFTPFKALDDDTFMRFLADFLCYFEALQYKYSLLVLNTCYAEQRINDMEDIYEKTYAALDKKGLNALNYNEALRNVRKRKTIYERIKGFLKWKLRGRL